MTQMLLTQLKPAHSPNRNQSVNSRAKLNCIKLYIGINTSLYSALSIWVLFTLLIKLVQGAQFLNITFLFVLFE